MTATAYDVRKSREGLRQLTMSASGRDIGDIPDVVNQARKAACERDFRLFCETYFAPTFPLAWSPDHLMVIGQIEGSVLGGGLFATAMPRGTGKTTLCECACVWAVFYGHRQFVALIGSDEGHALQMLDSIKTELESSDSLSEDFPEAVYPIVKLDGISHRCNGQICNGERTHIGWTADEIVLPTVPHSVAAGCIIKVAGLTGGIRGMKFKRQDGRTVRPDLVVVDDPQTDGSSRSPSQCETRERILAGAVLGLAGPGKKISGIMPCTVIRPGDMADNILNRDKHPEWNGTRTKMVYAFPVNEKLWDEYKRIRDDSLRRGNAGREATEFYRANREAMDEGARIAWEARFNEDELSALQHAMNLRFQDERAFFAEYQNEPLPEIGLRTDDLTPDQIAAKINRRKRGEVPVSCNRLTSFIDVQGTLLYHVVVAWEDDFTGYVVDYGAFPDQRRGYFTLRDAKPTLASVVKAAGLEGQIYGGLEKLTGELLSREWTRDDGAGLRIERCLIDANWGASTKVVRDFCHQSAHAAVLTPSHGKYIGAASSPMGEWPKKPGDRLGDNWRVRCNAESRKTRYVTYDTNHWKNFVHARLATAMGDKGCLSIFGDKPEHHRLFADHCTSEYRIRTEGRGRTVDEWRLRPERPDNHWWDCLVGSAVAASMLGVVLSDAGGQVLAEKPKRVSFAEMARRKRTG